MNQILTIIFICVKPDLMLGTDSRHRPLVSAVVELVSPLPVPVLSPRVSLVVKVARVGLVITTLKLEVTDTTGRRIVLETMLYLIC